MKRGGAPKQECRFCGEGCEEFILSGCCALARKGLEAFYELQPKQHPLGLKGLIRCEHLNRIGKAMRIKGGRKKCVLC